MLFDDVVEIHEWEDELYGKNDLIEVEAVFGQIKQNMGFRRFMLRGLENVST